MDFTTTEDQQALVGLATQILGERSTQAHLDALDAKGVWFDADLWKQLADAGIVGASLKEDVGGGGLGFTELALLLEQVGAHVAQVPLFETLLCAGLPIDHFGTAEQRSRDLPDVAAGTALLTAALVESGRDDLRRPVTTATPNGSSYLVSGTKTSVPYADQARRMLVPASLQDGTVVLLLVEPTAVGVTLRRGTATNGLPVFEVELVDVAGEVLVGPDKGADALAWLLDRALTGLAAIALGVSGTALRLSAAYTTSREQFGRAIATFQAVGHRLADAYIDVEAMRLTTLQAVWLLDAGLPGRDEARIAKWWASEGGHRVAHAAQHVHGGVGIDIDYELPRYFRWSKQVEFALGSAQAQLLSLGAALAAEPV
ncbi:MAG: putative acyl-CoA dehydrogenase [Frankiales bacterium]|nr:putative acyl-CoA dehydrogenase [Frankiales bacterium]